MPGVTANANRVNDFVVKFANVNGTGSASANSLVMKAIFRMGVPVTGKNYFPSNIQGLPTWYSPSAGSRCGSQFRSTPRLLCLGLYPKPDRSYP